MVSLEIHLQAMFTNDTVIVRVNGKEVFRETSVTTDTRRMRAAYFQTTVSPGEVTVSVEVPTRNVSGSQVFHVTGATFITVNLTDGQLEIREEPGGVFYA
jgi:hypothetical protein